MICSGDTQYRYLLFIVRLWICFSVIAVYDGLQRLCVHFGHPRTDFAKIRICASRKAVREDCKRDGLLHAGRKR